MHATQMGYNQAMDSWFMEACAAWSEEFAFPGYDDNFQYLMDLFGKTDVALNLGNGEEPELDDHWYSAWAFIKYLTEHTGNEIIKNIYELCLSQSAVESIDAELAAHWATDLQTLFVQYSIANVLMTCNAVFAPYTYSRAGDYETYITKEGGFVYENTNTPLNYTGTLLSWNSETDGNNRLMRMSSDYFIFTADRNFKITFDAVAGEASLVLVKTAADSVSFVSCEANESINVTDYANWLSFIPIVIRYDNNVTDIDPLNYTLSIGEATTPTGIATISSAVSVFPNPVNNYVTVSTNGISDLTLSISDITGKKILMQNVSGKNGEIDHLISV